MGHTGAALAVMVLATFNLTFRIADESLPEWDSSLYANSAYEMVVSGNWVATTSFGVLDYSNSKPPLNVWIIALVLDAIGPSLLAVRLASATAAWLTIGVLMLWSWRRFSPPTSLFAGLVLATCFGFLHVHSGRSADPDALLTLLLLLIVVVLDGARQSPWQRAWLGPLLAGVFLLKGMAVVLPLLLIGIVECRRVMATHTRWLPLAVAVGAFILPVGVWAVARWRIDQWAFFERIVYQDFLALSTQPLDNQAGSPFFYLNILQKHHYDWIIAAITVAVLCPPVSWASFGRRLAFWTSSDDRVFISGWWIAIGLLIPSLMQTKLPWYINPLYPMFALGVGAALAYGFNRARPSSHQMKLLIAMVVMAAVVAESKLVWYSYSHRDLQHSVQGVLLVEANRIRGAQVFGTSWNQADRFVLRALVQAEEGQTTTVEEFLNLTGPGQFLVLPADTVHPELTRVGANGRYGLYERRRQSP